MRGGSIDSCNGDGGWKTFFRIGFSMLLRISGIKNSKSMHSIAEDTVLEYAYRQEKSLQLARHSCTDCFHDT